MLTKVGRSSTIDSGNPASIYLGMKERIICAGYEHEVDWQSDLTFECTTETDFLREAAWVVLSSGFRESVVRQCFQRVSEAFLGWCNAEQINAHRELCENRAISVFGNRRKIKAITEIVERVANDGIECIKMQIQSRGIEYLQELPYIGPVTSYHLAKNLGLQVVKPDRHLVRMAHITGHDSPLEMCSKIAETVGDSLAVVDLVLWRYATLDKNYEMAFDNVVDEPRERVHETYEIGLVGTDPGSGSVSVLGCAPSDWLTHRRAETAKADKNLRT